MKYKLMQMESRKSSNNRRSQAMRLSPVIDAVIGNLGMKKRYNGWQIVSLWPQIVGEKIAQATRAEKFEDGILFVKVKDAAWRQELSMQIDSLLEAIHKSRYGSYVKQIRLA